jgi:hypothetical protein
MLLTASCSPPTGVVVAVVLLPAVEADTRVVVDAKTIASVKIVAAVARYALCSRRIFPLLSFSVFILCVLRMKIKDKRIPLN